MGMAEAGDHTVAATIAAAVIPVVPSLQRTVSVWNELYQSKWHSGCRKGVSVPAGTNRRVHQPGVASMVDALGNFVELD